MEPNEACRGKVLRELNDQDSIDLILSYNGLDFTLPEEDEETEVCPKAIEAAKRYKERYNTLNNLRMPYEETQKGSPHEYMSCQKGEVRQLIDIAIKKERGLIWERLSNMSWGSELPMSVKMRKAVFDE